LAPQPTKKEEQEDKKNKEIPEDKEKEVEKKNPKLAEQVREILQMPDEEYSDKKLTSELRQYIKEVDDRYNSVLADYKSHIAPSYWEFSMQQFNVS
jgi:hypothetical protein